MDADLFAWTPADMPGIPAEIIVHKLGLNSSRKPVKQKRRNHSVEKLIASREEVTKLLDAGFIREVQYPDWLSNVVLVRKSNGKWQMCVDFTDVNKACPKDSFPLPRIDLLVDSIAGHELLSFMDAYSGYNQIRMRPEDEEHTSFMIDHSTYCYKQGHGDHIHDLEESFEVLRKNHMKLNPAKCIFGVASGKFLGFIVPQRGIEANPKKIKALADMAPPRNLKDVQRLTGRLAALSHFLTKSGDKYQPFFKALEKQNPMGSNALRSAKPLSMN
ncbi:hypothetical protein Nepgr_028820 [Nepenthes gracilis]|uniref:Reverse transcriptase domain-containing protein n=1 Tax=Nepenthes gracilis TaxID=150966 RepID=A0AAD3TCS4_NEPGR|nr:hypothetical protein Nepgr_028820 [Nepenthes gracilis]